jgi:DNA-binding CsgD family transcriptional regulator
MTSESEKYRQILSLGTVEEKSRLIQSLFAEGRTKNEIEAVTGLSNRTVKKYLLMKDCPPVPRKNETVRGKEHRAAVEKVQAKADLVRGMKADGMSISEISKKTGFVYNTVRVYLSDDFSPVSGHYGKQREGKLYPYRENVLTMRAQGKTYSQIYGIIQEQGYGGTVDAIRGFISKEHRIVNDIQIKNGIGQTELIEKKWIVQLLYKPLDKVRAITAEQLAAIVKEYPLANTIFETINRFKGILKRRDTDALMKWIDDVASLEIEELSSFANGLKNDMTAVLNAFRYNYNNGLAEGSVNKVKVIKRVMYGRCSFALLRNKILAIEAMRSFK